MDAKEIKDERSDGNQGRDVILINGVAIDQAEFIHGGRRDFRGDTFATDDGGGSGPEFNDFVIHFLELANVTAAFLSSSPPSGSTFPFGTTTVYTTASDSCGDSTNCSFTVTVEPQPPALPMLAIAFKGNQLVISWSSGNAGYVLESTPDLTGPNWSAVTDQPVPVGTSQTVSLDLSNNTRFFRLRYSGIGE